MCTVQSRVVENKQKKAINIYVFSEQCPQIENGSSFSWRSRQIISNKNERENRIQNATKSDFIDLFLYIYLFQ